MEGENWVFAKIEADSLQRIKSVDTQLKKYSPRGRVLGAIRNHSRQARYGWFPGRVPANLLYRNINLRFQLFRNRAAGIAHIFFKTVVAPGLETSFCQ